MCLLKVFTLKSWSVMCQVPCVYNLDVSDCNKARAPIGQKTSAEARLSPVWTGVKRVQVCIDI